MPDSFSGTIPSNALPTGALFDSLLELKWKDIPVPYTSLHSRLRQDLSIHKFADRDGAHVEGKGRAPLEFTAKIPFMNNLAPGQNETFKNVYPTTRDNFLRACADKSSGALQHPEFGIITCKCETFEWELDAQVRSGVWGTVSWIETDDTGQDLDNDLANRSPTANVQGAAHDLTQNLAAVNKSLFPQPYVPPFSFDDLVFAVKGVIDAPTLLAKQIGGRMDNLVYQAQSLEDSLNRAGNANALNWPLLQAAERLKSAVFDLKATALSRSRAIALYTLVKDSTLCQAATDVNANVADVMLLNPAYVQSPIVPAGSVVRYYK